MTGVAIPCGDFTLESAVVRRPGTAWAVVCHPHPAFGGRMHTPLVVSLAQALAEAGLSTVRFNFRGLEGSGGTPTGGLLEQEDVRAVAAWARDQGAAQVALVGYSFGALMSLKAIAAGERPAAYAAVGLPTTIIGDDPARVADVKRALAAGIPSLFIAGDQDQFCETARIADWIAPISTATQIVEAGVTHFPSGPDATRISTTTASFISSSVR